MPAPQQVVSVAIVGAGPYGLSLAAYLRTSGLSFRIFGSPMAVWARHMPAGIMLKSEGFASTLFDPGSTFTLGQFCREQGLPYNDLGAPIPCETFVAYGLEFQRRLVPTLEPTDVVSIDHQSPHFLLTTALGESFLADRVVLAVGITHFAFTPDNFASLPPAYLSHSLDHHDLTPYAGRTVAVIGGGSSAVDLAGLLAEAGAEAHLVARRPAIAFHAPTPEPRPLRQRLLKPRSGLGLGWRSRMCTDAPHVFHRLPRRLRARIIQRHLGPSSGWFARQKVEGHVALHLGSTVRHASVLGTRVFLDLVQQDRTTTLLEVDHVIAATGFKPQLARLTFLSHALRSAIRAEDTGAPILSRNFESSVPGLYFVGLASANAFGPVARFAFGARFTARHLARHLTRDRTTVFAAVRAAITRFSTLMRRPRPAAFVPSIPPDILHS